MILDSVRESSTNRFYNTAIDETADVTPVDYSSCLTVDEACMCALVETMNEYDAFEQAVMEAEIEYVQENGVEPIYEKADIKHIVNSGVALVKEWLGRILGVIDRFMKEVAAKLATMKTKLIKPNADKLAKGEWDEKWNFEDFDYNNISNVLETELVNGNALEFKNEDDGATNAYNFEHNINTAVGKYGADRYSELTVKLIKEKALGKKITINKSYVGNGAKFVSIVSGFAQGVKAIKDQEKQCKTVAAELIKQIKSVVEANTKNMDKADVKAEKDTWSTAITLAKKINVLNTTIVTAKLSLLMGQLNQAYKICGIMVRSASTVGTKVNNANAAVAGAAKKGAETASKAANAAKEKGAEAVDAVKNAGSKVVDGAKKLSFAKKDK